VCATTQFEDPRIAHRQRRMEEAVAHEARLPLFDGVWVITYTRNVKITLFLTRYKRDLRRKMLRLRDLFKHRMATTLATLSPVGWGICFFLEIN
jgi:hypothetical protein